MSVRDENIAHVQEKLCEVFGLAHFEACGKTHRINAVADIINEFCILVESKSVLAVRHIR